MAEAKAIAAQLWSNMAIFPKEICSVIGTYAERHPFRWQTPEEAAELPYGLEDHNNTARATRDADSGSWCCVLSDMPIDQLASRGALHFKSHAPASVYASVYIGVRGSGIIPTTFAGAACPGPVWYLGGRRNNRRNYNELDVVSVGPDASHNWEPTTDCVFEFAIERPNAANASSDAGTAGLRSGDAKLVGSLVLRIWPRAGGRLSAVTLPLDHPQSAMPPLDRLFVAALLSRAGDSVEFVPPHGE